MSTALIWFRQDLRVFDHVALTRAVKAGHRIVCCYIFDQQTPGMWSIGGASQWWLHHALDDLNRSLAEMGGQLILRRGCYVDELEKLVTETQATALYFSRNHEPFMQDVETQLHVNLTERDIEVCRYPGNILFDPDKLRTKSGTPFKVFTPFWKNCLNLSPPAPPVLRPESIDFAASQPKSDALKHWKLLPSKPNWAKGMEEYWRPTEDQGHKVLHTFLDEAASRYKEQRDIPSVNGTSCLSPYLHYGQISPRQVWHASQQHVASVAGNSTGVNVFLSEIGWREFSYHLLTQFPELPVKAFRANFQKFPWRKNSRQLRKWQLGMTGFPIVDAGMRQLWHTGWMHNRIRMVVASFLVKDLLIPWQEGAKWFWDTLLDADLASNSASWQWVAGSGADASPYFRIFNPILQGQKFDPNGDYVRKWVPELEHLPNKWIHQPETAPKLQLEEAQIKLGETYPLPIIDRKVARARALEAYQQIKQKKPDQ